MRITSTLTGPLAQGDKPVCKRFEPASEKSLARADRFVSTQHRDGEGGIALVLLGLMAVPPVLGAIGGGALAQTASDGALLAVTAGVLGGGILGCGITLAAF